MVNETNTVRVSAVSEEDTLFDDFSVHRYVSEKLLRDVPDGSLFVIPDVVVYGDCYAGTNPNIPHMTWGPTLDVEAVRDWGDAINAVGTTLVALSPFRRLLDTLTQELDISNKNMRDGNLSGFFQTVANRQGIESIYLLRDRDRVRAFLQRNPELVEPLVEARSRCRDLFGDATCTLSVFVDPGEESPEELVVSILVDDASKRVFENLDKIDSDWWVHQNDVVRDKLVIRAQFL
jgi:hypothetical protein